MNFTEDEAIIAVNFDQNQTWKPVSAGTKSKDQVTKKQQQVNIGNAQPRPSSAQKTQYVSKGQQTQVQKASLQPSQLEKEPVEPKNQSKVST